MDKFEEHDIVTTQVELPNIPKGSRCTIVHVFPCGTAFLVEYQNEVNQVTESQIKK